MLPFFLTMSNLDSYGPITGFPSTDSEARGSRSSRGPGLLGVVRTLDSSEIADRDVHEFC